MIGDMPAAESRKLDQLLPQFSEVVQEIFENTAPLMVVPPTLAIKYNLNIWTKFETSVTRTLEIANEIVEVGLKANGNGIMKEMQANDMSTEMIKRIFVDLIIAAGDTVIVIVGHKTRSHETNFFVDCVHNSMDLIPIEFEPFGTIEDTGSARQQ